MQTAALVFLLLANAPDGSQTVTAAIPLTEAQCLPLQAAIWDAAEASPVVYRDELGDAHALDAACVPVATLAAEMLPCASEDSPWCYWNAATMGNGRGRSFIALLPADPAPQAVYLESTP